MANLNQLSMTTLVGIQKYYSDGNKNKLTLIKFIESFEIGKGPTSISIINIYVANTYYDAQYNAS